MREKILDNLDNFVFAKDKNFKFLYCNEKIAEVAGLDSPSQIKGKTDYDLCWRNEAALYREGDILVLKGQARINVPEVQTQKNRIVNILTTKSLLRDKKDNIIGIVGSYIDITGYSFKQSCGYYDENEQKFYLGEVFNNEYFSLIELKIFRRLLLGYSSGRMAKELQCSRNNVEENIGRIKKKLNCDSKNDIPAKALKFGLAFILEYPILAKIDSLAKNL